MPKASDTKLTACPFCGGQVELYKYREIIKCKFTCKKCKVQVEFPRGFDSKDSIKRWNKRALPIPQEPEVEDSHKGMSETIVMDAGPDQFKTVYYKPACQYGFTDCIYDPAYIKATYPDWYKKLYGEKLPKEVTCEGCINGDRYDDQDK